jgi:hypothetical protein
MSIEKISAEEVRAYREGINGNHFAVVGIERIMVPFQS